MAIWSTAGKTDSRPTDSTQATRRFLERDATFIAEIEQNLVGTVIAEWDGWRAHEQIEGEARPGRMKCSRHFNHLGMGRS
ncbi:hypothetical protein [Amnibacterium kyonggiense]|uniref:hypothetical protein n=1 Tax=Amnibacterium kyonggiense TaxID=595671 RepID=UPI00105DC1BE|nr:hypothetical protein [Amnibacterium kyonggiense]